MTQGCIFSDEPFWFLFLTDLGEAVDRFTSSTPSCEPGTTKNRVGAERFFCA